MRPAVSRDRTQCWAAAHMLNQTGIDTQSNTAILLTASAIQQNSPLPLMHRAARGTHGKLFLKLHLPQPSKHPTSERDPSSPALLKKARNRNGAVLVLLTGAGNGTRTRECQLGKLMPYHLAMPAIAHWDKLNAWIVYTEHFKGAI